MNAKEINKGKKIFNKTIIIGLIILAFLLALVCIILCLTIPSNVMTTYEIIMTILTAYSSLSLILLVVQINRSKQDSHDQHDEKRREKTVEFMIQWSESLTAKCAYAVYVVEKFSHEQCVHLYKREPFEVSFEIKKELCPLCPNYSKKSCSNCFKKHNKYNKSSKDSKTTIKDKNRLYKVDKVQCTEIRGYIIQYLNILESLLISWKQGIVDRDILEEQFNYLYDPKSGHDTLQSFRNVAGDGKSYPTIEEFCLELRNKRQETNNKMKELL